MANTITVIDSGSVSTAGQGGQSLITGTPTAASYQQAAITGSGGFAITLSGTWTGTVAFEGTSDGSVTWTPVDAYLEGVDGAIQSATSNCIVKGNAAGCTHVRARATASVTGTVNVVILGNVVLDLIHTVPVGGVTDVTLFASAARSTSQNVDMVNYNGKGVRVILNVSAAAGTAGVAVQIRGKDSISGSYYQLNATPTAVTTGLKVYDVVPSAESAANGITQATNAFLPRYWNVNVVNTDNQLYTYSVSAVVLL